MGSASSAQRPARPHAARAAFVLIVTDTPAQIRSPQPSCKKSCCHESLSIYFLGGVLEQGHDTAPQGLHLIPARSAFVPSWPQRTHSVCHTGRGGGCSGVLALEGPHMQTWVHSQPSRTPSESFAGLFRSTRLLTGKLRASSSLPCCRRGKRRCMRCVWLFNPIGGLRVGIRRRAGQGQDGVQREAPGAAVSLGCSQIVLPPHLVVSHLHPSNLSPSPASAPLAPGPFAKP